MDRSDVGSDPDHLPWPAGNAFPENADDLLLAQSRGHHCLGAGRFDDDQFRLYAGQIESKVLRPYAVNPTLSVGKCLAAERQNDAVIGSESFRRNLAVEEIHRRSADETGDKHIRGGIVEFKRHSYLFDDGMDAGRRRQQNQSGNFDRIANSEPREK